MKKITTCIFLFFIISSSVSAQSDSFLAFGEKFSGREGVHHFRTNGFLARSIVWIASETEFNGAIKSIRSIDLIIVPKSAFSREQVTVAGFKKVLRKDSFEELARVKDRGDDVTLYARPTQSRNTRYIILVEESDEVVLIELEGHIDPDLLLKNRSLSFSENKQKS
jgi:Domain of unknown function (DUF4252)